MQDLVKYLLMVRKKVKEPAVDTELVYAYAKVRQAGSHASDTFILIFLPCFPELPVLSFDV